MHFVELQTDKYRTRVVPPTHLPPPNVRIELRELHFLSARRTFESSNSRSLWPLSVFGNRNTDRHKFFNHVFREKSNAIMAKRESLYSAGWVSASWLPKTNQNQWLWSTIHTSSYNSTSDAQGCRDNINKLYRSIFGIEMILSSLIPFQTRCSKRKPRRNFNSKRKAEFPVVSYYVVLYLIWNPRKMERESSCRPPSPEMPVLSNESFVYYRQKNIRELSNSQSP